MVGLFIAVDAGNVGMVQGGEHLCFTFEASEPFGIVRKTIGQDFDCNVAVETSVACAKDFSHPARTELRDDLVLSDISPIQMTPGHNLKAGDTLVGVGGIFKLE